ncbi:hypothetical protein V5F77_02745 [Xanthobacter sp. DSM 24535]|uniref:hypothetical protein n=1 Tax=Roseixanthobacter psychrophilus TaxID=3119917 RepID=UPI00372C3507
MSRYWFHIPWGTEKAHAERLVRGLSRMPGNFTAVLCEVCKGHGKTRYEECQWCEATGLTYGMRYGSPMHTSVVHQVLNAASGDE